MEPQEKHSMVIASTHPSGAEEWVCPTCGRRILMEWPPHYRKIVLEEGDPNAIHSGSKGGLQLGIQQIEQPENLPADLPEDLPEEIDQATLSPWMEFMQYLDIDDKLDNMSGS